MDINTFDNLASNDNKYQLEIENYLVPNRENAVSQLRGTEDDDLIFYNEPKVLVREPQISIWEYLVESELKELLSLKNGSRMRKFIDKKLEKQPRGLPRIIFRELMYNATKFCKTNSYDIEQTAAVLSQFYLTHLYFTSSLNVGAQKLYTYFKNLQLFHSLPFPPNHTKLFNLDEVRSTVVFFCRIYLRNLPLIRFLTLPNFALCACYKLEPEMKGKKGGKKGKSKKDKKKGKKK